MGYFVGESHGRYGCGMLWVGAGGMSVLGELWVGVVVCVGGVCCG